MQLRKFGFFDELPKEEAQLLLTQLRAEAPRPDEQKILAYLRGGLLLLAVPGVAFDLLANEVQVIGSPHVFTDGAWAWPEELLFYIERYHIEVPREFYERMERHRWVCPPVQNPQALELEGWQES